MFSGVATTPGGGIDTRGGRGVTGQRSPGQRSPGQRSHGLTPIAPRARSSRCRTGGVLNLQAVFPSGGKGHKIRLAQENGGTTPWRNLSSSIVAADRRSPVRASRFTTLSITSKRDGTPRLSRRSSASARARLTRHFAISRSMRKKSARNTNAFSPELPREIPRSSRLSSTLATPGSWNTCESEHEPAGEGIAMKAILADNDGRRDPRRARLESPYAPTGRATRSRVRASSSIPADRQARPRSARPGPRRRRRCGGR